MILMVDTIFNQNVSNSKLKKGDENLRKNLKRYMVDNDLSTKQLANDLSVTQNYMSSIITGKRNASLILINNFKEKYNINSLDEAIEIFKDE